MTVSEDPISGPEYTPAPPREPAESSVDIYGKPGREGIHLGGRLVPCTRAELVLDVDRGAPVLTLTLPIVHGVGVCLEQPQVFLDDPTQEALIALGWRPPLAEPRGFDYPSGVPLTDEEAAELERRLREELARPHAHKVKVIPPSPPYTPKAGEIITVGGVECTVNHVVHTADKLEITATRLHAVPAQPAGSAVLIDIPARDGAE